jgi:hypothetical protein
MERVGWGENKQVPPHPHLFPLEKELFLKLAALRVRVRGYK